MGIRNLRCKRRICTKGTLHRSTSNSGRSAMVQRAREHMHTIMTLRLMGWLLVKSIGPFSDQKLLSLHGFLAPHSVSRQRQLSGVPCTVFKKPETSSTYPMDGAMQSRIDTVITKLETLRRELRPWRCNLNSLIWT